ncbi:DUF1707 domain-containing protein [Catenulispora sp. NF23]|uniref:DUF1707 domain-containing protein n=1 Tax=Catenulispora pinistramenti TaxID=2705254 RepID=A0ABS5KT06_9ACTN|nr:DUF1707 domain-containing protein [Catenulispora pinistramenti]MBS2537288.1 DUF1707 domain-containing protein [Catenulispora pinistramenti]MBS2549165.1 DUF1707 domain-containing protein [Catenulispora pinistramenti]
MSTDPSSQPVLRASDADRDRVIDTLRSAVTDGRLDAAEYDERVEQALAARTFEALAPLTADLVAIGAAARPLPAVPAPAGPAVESVLIREKHGPVRREGRWTLPHRLVLRTLWCTVTLDLTRAVLTGPELIVEIQGRGNGVVLVLAPGMVVDANELSVRHGSVAITNGPDDGTPETLRIHLVGRNKHGSVTTVWETPDEAERSSGTTA